MGYFDTFYRTIDTRIIRTDPLPEIPCTIITQQVWIRRLVGMTGSGTGCSRRQNCPYLPPPCSEGLPLRRRCFRILVRRGRFQYRRHADRYEYCSRLPSYARCDWNASLAVEVGECSNGLLYRAFLATSTFHNRTYLLTNILEQNEGSCQHNFTRFRKIVL